MTYMMKMKLSCGAHTLATFLFFASTVWADDPVDFEKVIAPILEQNCYDCHGADEKKGKLRLHTVADIQKAAVVVAGKPDESKLLQRISLAADSKKLMPKDGDPLPAEQIALIRLWIEQGSKYPAAEAGESTAADEPASEPSLFETITAAPEDAIVKVKETGALVMRVANNTQAISVSFRFKDGDTTDDVLPSLGQLSEQLVWLDLGNSAVTDAGLAPLRDLKHLMRLHLENTNIGDAALDHLAEMKNLEYLNLHSTNVTNEGLSRLKNLKNLKKLYLWQAPITQDAAKDLSAAIPGLDVNLGNDHPEVMLEETNKAIERAAKEKEDAAKREEEARKEKEAATAREEEMRKKIAELEAAVAAFREKAGWEPPEESQEEEAGKDDEKKEEEKKDT